MTLLSWKSVVRNAAYGTCDRSICGVSYAEIYVFTAGIMCYH